MQSRKFTPALREIVVIAHNIRSILNVGSILRSAEGFGVRRVFLSGTTLNAENQLPHVRAKMAKELHKTALGAEEIVSHEFVPDVFELIKKMKLDGFRIVGLEQDSRAIPLPDYLCRVRPCKEFCRDNNSCRDVPCKKIALVLGEEVHGLTPKLRDTCDDLVEIPMFGQKESLNVAVATGIVLYYFTATHSAP